MMESDPRLILLHASDNIFVLRKNISASERVRIEGREIDIGQDIPMAHKIARLPIAEGAKIIKYGAPIGVARVEIRPGEHVHVHNVRSDYTPSYTLDREGAGQA